MYIQPRAKVYKRLLNKPHENEVTLRGQKPPLKCCQPFELLTYFEKGIRSFCILNTVEPDFSKLFERRKNVYYCQVFTIYHVIYAVIDDFGKQQKVY